MEVRTPKTVSLSSPQVLNWLGFMDDSIANGTVLVRLEVLHNAYLAN